MRIFTSLFLVAIFQSAFAQSEPFGYQIPREQLMDISLAELATFNHEVLLAEDTRIEEEGGRTNIGRIIPLNLNDQSAGTWTTLANNDRVWQYRFRSAGAKGVCVYFDALYIPQGAVMFLYSIDRKTMVGPFSLDDCNVHGRFMMGEVLGDEAILEYYEPASVVGTPTIGIQSVSHMYRYVYDYSDFEVQDNSRASDFCEVDVNCPEGTEWTAQRDAVVRLLINDGTGQGLCSGSVVNTTARDCRKYILTALHCGIGVNDAEWQQCSVRFKYQRASCGSGSAPSTSNRVGVLHLADSNDGGGDNGSDFLLLELEDAIPETYNVFYAGWDSRANTPADVVCIHHPAGDVKKISTATNIVSGTWQAPGYHWRVSWMATETNHGVTEGGSSGSPLFNEAKRIVGQLTGGSSYCDSPTAPDFYGKMDKSWDDNPNAANQKLKVWLDPNNTGELFLDGAYSDPNNPTQPCMVSVQQDELSFEEVSIFPSVADEVLNIVGSDYHTLIGYRIYNAHGALMNVAPIRSSRETVACNSLSAGVYFITFESESGAQLTKKFIIEHK